MSTVETAAWQYIDIMNEVSTNHQMKLFPTLPHLRDQFEIHEGRKYIKVISRSGDNRRVHSFIDKKTGDLYKAASWNAPAKGARYNILTDLLKLSQIADPYGSYLYKR